MNWSLAEIHAEGPRRFDVDWTTSFSLIPKTTSLVAAGHSLVRWNWGTGREEARFVHPQPFQEIVVSPDASLVAAVSGERVLNVLISEKAFHQTPGNPWLLWDWNPGGTVGSVCFSPDSRTIAVRFQRDGTDGQPQAREMWLHGPPEFRTPERIPVAGSKAAAFAPDGRRLAVATDTGLVLWEIEKHGVIWNKPQSDIAAVAFSPNGKYLVTGGTNRLVVVRGAADGSIRHQLASHRSTVNALSFSPDSRTLATASKDGAIKLWHMPTGQELFELKGPGPSCIGLEFSEDGRNLIALVDSGPGRRDILVFQSTESAPGD